jgi:hypothetical protein
LPFSQIKAVGKLQVAGLPVPEIALQARGALKPPATLLRVRDLTHDVLLDS